MELRSVRGELISGLPILSSSKEVFELGVSDYIELKFSVLSPLSVGVGSYIEYNGKRYVLLSDYVPAYNSVTGGYDYTLRLDAWYWGWHNKILKFRPLLGGMETDFDLTADLPTHLGILLDNLASLGLDYNGVAYTVDVSGLDNSHEAKLVSYSATSILGALQQLCSDDLWGCEWWVTDNVIHLGKCERGDTPVSLHSDWLEGRRPNVEKVGVNANGEKIPNRYYFFGSERNLPEGYREGSIDTSVTVSGVVQKRLMLPEGIDYIDLYRYDSGGNRVYLGEDGYDTAAEMSIEEVVEAVKIMDEIYPRREDCISAIRTRTIYDTAENADGTTTQTAVTVYQVQLASSAESDKWFKAEYLHPNGETLKMRFTGAAKDEMTGEYSSSGLLNGMEYEVQFNPDAAFESSIESQWFEIVRNEEYGRMLPDSVLNPEVGDRLVLFNWNIALMDEDGLGYIADAEQELYDSAVLFVRDAMIDSNNYECTMMSDVMLGYDLATHEINSDDALVLELGQRVMLYDKLFLTGKRLSRIIGWEKKIDLPYDSPKFIVGETFGKGRLDSLQSEVDALTLKGLRYEYSGGGVYVIGANDRTKATDSNVYSALRSDRQFAAKDKTEIIEGIWQFVNYLKSRNFEPGTLGTGWWLGNEDGKSYLEVDKLYVRLKAIFDTLEIKHIEHVGGEFILSPAGVTIKSVTEVVSGALAFYGVQAVATTAFGSDETIEPTRVVFDTNTKQFVGVYIKSGVITPTYYLTFKGSEKYGVEGSYYEDKDGTMYLYSGGELTATEEYNAYRCYFTVEDEDATIYNQFKVDDLVFCKTFNLGANEEVAATSQRYYWRKCVGVGKDYIELSMNHCDTDSDAPLAGDAVVTLGNLSDTDRQNAIVISSYGAFSPSIIMYKGIDSYSLEGKAEVQISPSGSKFTGEFVVQTADGNKYSLVEFLNDRISLNVHSELYDEECAIVTSPNLHQETEDYIIDLNENCLKWQPGDRIIVRLDILIDNNSEPDVRLLTEEATAGVFKAWDWSQELYDPSGEDFEGTLTAEILIDDIVNWERYGEAYLIFRCNSQYDLYDVSVKKISLEGTLRDTGINIEKGSITLNAEKTTIQDGDTTIAMFEVDEDGTPKLTASLIDAERIDVTKLNTKPLNLPHISIEGQQIQIKEADTDTSEGKTKILIHGGKLSDASQTIGELNYEGLWSWFGDTYGDDSGIIYQPDTDSEDGKTAVDESLDRGKKSAIVPLSTGTLEVLDPTTIYQYSTMVGTATIDIRSPKTDENGVITEMSGGTAYMRLYRYYHSTKKDFKLGEAEVVTELGKESWYWDENYLGEKTFNRKYAIPNGTLPVGYYRFAIQFVTTALVQSGHFDVGGDVGATNNITGVTPTTMQEIALDGFNFRYESASDSLKIAYIKSNEDGFEVRNGNYGIRISANAEHPGAVYTTDGFLNVYPFGTSANPTIAYPNIGASATVDSTSGTPSVTVTKSGSDAAPIFTFSFSGLKGTDGAKGEKGDKGDKGDTGDAGTSISEIATTYQASDSGTTVPTGEWLTTPEAAKGKYLWSRMAIQLSTGAVRYHYTVAYQGEDATGDVPTPIFGVFVDDISTDFIDWLNSTIATDFSKVVYISNLKMFAVKGSSRYCVKFTAGRGVTQEDYQTVDSDAKTAAVHKDKTYVRVDTDELYIYNDTMGLTQVNKKIKIQ